MQQIEKNQVLWLNVAKPSTDDLLFLKEKFGLANSVLTELSVPVVRTKIEEYEDYLFLVMHFPVFDPATRKTTPTELDFIITPTTVVTAYTEPIPNLESFFVECLNHPSGQKEYFKSAGYLLFCILDRLIDSCLPMLDHILDNIEKIEEKIFRGTGKEMISEVAIIKRDIIDFRRTIKPQRSVLEILAQKAPRFFGAQLDFISQEVIGSNIRVWNTLENHMEMIGAIERTNESLSSYQLSSIVKILTILSLLTFPLNLINGFLGMSLFDNVNFMHYPYTYMVVLFCELFIGFALYLLFKKKRWL
jgi:magnesium transporter